MNQLLGLYFSHELECFCLDFQSPEGDLGLLEYVDPPGQVLLGIVELMSLRGWLLTTEIGQSTAKPL